jgi:hypothetical protein
MLGAVPTATPMYVSAEAADPVVASTAMISMERMAR